MVEVPPTRPDRPGTVTAAAVLMYIFAAAWTLAALLFAVLAVLNIGGGTVFAGALLGAFTVLSARLALYLYRLAGGLWRTLPSARDSTVLVMWIFIGLAGLNALVTLASLGAAEAIASGISGVVLPVAVLILLRVSHDDFSALGAGGVVTRVGRRNVILTRPDVAAGTPLLEVVDLKTHFLTAAGPVRAVDGVSFTLERGRTLGVVGESGSGKTILSRSIMGLLPTRNVYRAGSARYEGTELVGVPASAMRGLWGTEMAMVFQDPMTSLNPVMKVGNQITESLRHHLGMDAANARETAIALLRSVGIPEPAQRVQEYPHQLSGGMRQRVMIAISLACGPRLLFADEPTTALDVTVQAQILDLLQAQQTERHMAMILITHDLGVVAGRADEIAVMYAGKIVEKAPTGVLFTSTRHPYTEALLKSIPKLEHTSHTRLAVIPGRPPDLVSPPEGCNFSPRCPYAQPKCFVDEPPLTPAAGGGHEFACWYPVGTPEGAEALARNQKAGVVSEGVA